MVGFALLGWRGGTLRLDRFRILRRLARLGNTRWDSSARRSSAWWDPSSGGFRSPHFRPGHDDSGTERISGRHPGRGRLARLRQLAPSPIRRLTARRLIGVLSLIAFAVLAASVHQNPYFGWDLAVARWLQRIPGLQTPMEIVSYFVYGARPYVLTVLTALVLIARRRRTGVAFLVASAAVAGLLNQVVKVAIGRPRPSPALVAVTRRLTDFSFPSGHVMFYVAFFG